MHGTSILALLRGFTELRHETHLKSPQAQNRCLLLCMPGMALSYFTRRNHKRARMERNLRRETYIYIYISWKYILEVLCSQSLYYCPCFWNKLPSSLSFFRSHSICSHKPSLTQSKVGLLLVFPLPKQGSFPLEHLTQCAIACVILCLPFYGMSPLLDRSLPAGKRLAVLPICPQLLAECPARRDAQ